MPARLPPGVSPDSTLGQRLILVGEMLQDGRFSDAVGPMEEAAALLPQNARLQADLGSIYAGAGRPDDALKPLRCAIELNPRLALAHWQLGAALQALNDHDEAIKALENAVLIRPDLVDAYVRLALLYLQKNRHTDALKSYRSAAQAAADPVEKQVIEAEICKLEGRQEEAESLLRAALAQQPNLPTAHGTLGKIFMESGRFSEAFKHLEAQVDQTPHSGRHYYDLVRCKKITEADNHVLQRMENALGAGKMDDVNRSLLLLAQGKAFDDLGRYEAAMQCFDRASELRSRAFKLDTDRFEKTVDEIIALFSADRIAQLTSGNSDQTPLLIVGMPRSGTTLVEQIVSSHPDVVDGGELAFWKSQLDTLVGGDGPSLDKDFIEAAASSYRDLLRGISPDAMRISDKNPFNFLAIGLIHLSFPKAGIIHCIRSPIDTALSIHQTHFSKFVTMPTGGEDLVRYIAAYRRLMDHWIQVLPKNRMLEIEYERLVAAPHAEIRRAIEYIGLPWDASCLTPHVNTRLVKTPSGFQVRQSINTGSVARWRHYEPWLGPLGALFKYEQRAE